MTARSGVSSYALPGTTAPWKVRARHILEGAVKGEMSAKRMSFPALAARLRRETEGGRAQTPSEVLIREDREAGHRVI